MFKSKLFIVFFIFSLSLLVLSVSGQYAIACAKRYTRTIAILKVTRANIQAFKETTGQIPSSLSEITKYDKNHPDIEFDPLPLSEYISDKRGNCNEYDELNGMGGWYYNATTGEVKVNITKPIKYYFKFYFGSHGNDVPADW